MQLETLIYSGEQKKWSVDSLPELDSPQTLVLVFGAPEYFDDPAPIKELAQNYPSSHLIGCSSSGEIYSNEIHDASLSVAICRFDSTSLKNISVPISAKTSEFEAACQRIVEGLQSPDLRAVFVLGSGLDVNFAALIQKLQQNLGKEVVISGGIGGDADRFARTWVIENGLPKENTVTAVGFYGDAIQIGYGSQGGWQPSSAPMLISKAKDNVLYELNGRSALNWYKVQLRKYKVQLPAGALFFPLAISRFMDSKNYVVRTILGIDEAAGTMTFAGEIPLNHFARFMTATQNQLVAGAESAARMVDVTISEDKPSLSVAISCVGRRLVMEEQTSTELKAVLDLLPQNTKQVGFYSYGEICPQVKNGYSALHNQTMTLTLFSEK